MSEANEQTALFTYNLKQHDMTGQPSKCEKKLLQKYSHAGKNYRTVWHKYAQLEMLERKCLGNMPQHCAAKC